MPMDSPDRDMILAKLGETLGMQLNPEWITPSDEKCPKECEWTDEFNFIYDLPFIKEYYGEMTHGNLRV